MFPNRFWSVKYWAEWWPAYGASTIDRINPFTQTRDLMYIEQITFREPYNVQLVGGDDDRLSVFLAQRGLPQI